MEIKWGLVPDMAGMVLMRGLVRDDVARELTYSGRMFAGEEAVQPGPGDPRLRRSARRGPGLWPPRSRARTRTRSAPASG